MCRMTEESIRGNRAIWRPGRYVVCEDSYGDFYVLARLNFPSTKVKYAITVRPKHNPQHVMCDA